MLAAFAVATSHLPAETGEFRFQLSHVLWTIHADFDETPLNRGAGLPLDLVFSI